MKKGVVLAAALIVVAATSGCKSTPVNAESSARSEPDNRERTQDAAPLRLIVVFRNIADPSDPAFLLNLSRTLGTPIAYLHPISGGAHVLRVTAPPETGWKVVERLRQRPDVVDVQPDMPVRIQQ